VRACSRKQNLRRCHCRHKPYLNELLDGLDYTPTPIQLIVSLPYDFEVVVQSFCGTRRDGMETIPYKISLRSLRSLRLCDSIVFVVGGGQPEVA
jgi:hypothetical protein